VERLEVVCAMGSEHVVLEVLASGWGVLSFGTTAFL
jgi:ribulose 1,5-bisphosphate carboxylase large subunit-like protein